MVLLMHIVIPWTFAALLILLVRRAAPQPKLPQAASSPNPSTKASPLSRKERARLIAEQLAENLRRATQSPEPSTEASPFNLEEWLQKVATTKQHK